MRVAYTIYPLRRTYAYLRLTRTTITATISNGSADVITSIFNSTVVN